MIIQIIDQVKINIDQNISFLLRQKPLSLWGAVDEHIYEQGRFWTIKIRRIERREVHVKKNV